MAKGSTSAAAKVGVATDKPKKAGRQAHPGVGGKTGYPFETMPTDFSFAEHKGLKKKDFANGGGFMQYRAAELRHRATKLTTLADSLEKRAIREATFGDEKTKKKANRAAKMKEQLAKLQQELLADGINIDTL